jgi:hypothetical protein
MLRVHIRTGREATAEKIPKNLNISRRTTEKSRKSRKTPGKTMKTGMFFALGACLGNQAGECLVQVNLITQ